MSMLEYLRGDKRIVERTEHDGRMYYHREYKRQESGGKQNE